MEKEILLRWKRNQIESWRKMKREELNNIFLALIPPFSGKNENSKELVDIIRVVESIFINWTITLPEEYKEMRLDYWFADGNKGSLAINKDENPIIIALFNGICMENSNIPSTFKMEWMVNGKEESKELDRENVRDIFQKLVFEYADNNGISKKIVSIVPYVEKFIINWDNTGEINSLYYTILDSDELKGIPISATHKEVWKRLKMICGLLPSEE